MENENKDIRIEYDTVSNSYFIVWQPMLVVGTGSSRKAALDDLKKAAHFGIDAILNVEIEKVG